MGAVDGDWTATGSNVSRGVGEGERGRVAMGRPCAMYPLQPYVCVCVGVCVCVCVCVLAGSGEVTGHYYIMRIAPAELWSIKTSAQSCVSH